MWERGEFPVDTKSESGLSLETIFYIVLLQLSPWSFPYYVIYPLNFNKTYHRISDNIQDKNIYIYT